MNWPARFVVGVLRGYQRTVSPFLPRVCRFEPTCSEFARQAVLSHGLTRGLWLGLKRIARCHPFHPGGYDPPPAAPGEKAARDRLTLWKNEQSWPRS